MTKTRPLIALGFLVFPGALYISFPKDKVLPLF